MAILDDDHFPDIISWLPDGSGFTIHDKKRFEVEVLPVYFLKQSKYTSFTRRMNRWGFTIQLHGHKSASYFHPMFIRGVPARCLGMSLKPKSRGGGSNKAKHQEITDDTLEDASNNPGGGILESQIPSSPQGQASQVNNSKSQINLITFF